MWRVIVEKERILVVPGNGPDAVPGETALEAMRNAGVLKGMKTTDLFHLPVEAHDLCRRVAKEIGDGRPVFGVAEGQFALDVGRLTGRALERADRPGAGLDWEDFLVCGGVLRPLTPEEVEMVIYYVLTAEEWGRLLGHVLGE